MACKCGKNATCQCAEPVKPLDPFAQWITGCPPAYNDCGCSCHRIPGTYHIVACCYPGQNDSLLNQEICNLDGMKFGNEQSD